MMILEDLYIFLFGLSILLLSIAIIAGMTFTFCIIITAFTKRNSKERDKEKKEDEQQEETADEKRRKRNAEIIKKYMH